MILISCYYTEKQVFPRGSPLLQDLSRAVLSVTEGDEMTRIERKWLGDSDTCTSSSTSVSSSSLGFRSFAGLFIITGSVSGLMLLIYIGMFLYKERETLRNLTTTDQTPWEKIHAWFQHYDQFDQKFKSPTFKEYVRSLRSQEGSRDGAVRQTRFVGSSSPGNSSNQLPEASFDFVQGEATPPPVSESCSTSNGGPTEEIELTGHSLEG